MGCRAKTIRFAIFAIPAMAVCGLSMVAAAGAAAEPGEVPGAAAEPGEGARVADRSPAAASPADANRRAEAIHLAGRYMIRVCQPSGRFVYRVNLNAAVKVKPKYNMLRHAGGIYALVTYAQYSQSPKARAAALRAAGYLKKSVVAVPGRHDTAAVWSNLGMWSKAGKPEAKLGGTGLGLVALLSVEKIAPGTTSLEELQRLGRFLLYMQKPDGSFYSKFHPTSTGRDDSWISLYYPGEAALGLTMLYERDGVAGWLAAASKAMGYLARSRKGRKTVEADHWALMATARMLALDDTGGVSPARAELIAHAVQICESMLAARARALGDAASGGSFDIDGRTTPTATNMEGLLAAMEFLPPGQAELRRRIRSALDECGRFLVRSQVREGKWAGGIPRAIAPLPPEHPRWSWAFNERATEIRIDYVQHALCALVGLADQGEPAKTPPDR